MFVSLFPTRTHTFYSYRSSLKMGKKGSERGGFSFCSESIDYSTCQDLCQLTDQRLILPLYRIVSRTLFVKGEDELHHL